MGENANVGFRKVIAVLRQQTDPRGMPNTIFGLKVALLHIVCYMLQMCEAVSKYLTVKYCHYSLKHDNCNPTALKVDSK